MNLSYAFHVPLNILVSESAYYMLIAIMRNIWKLQRFENCADTQYQFDSPTTSSM